MSNLEHLKNAAECELEISTEASRMYDVMDRIKTEVADGINLDIVVDSEYDALHEQHQRITALATQMGLHLERFKQS